MGEKGCQGVGTGKGSGKGSEIIANQGRTRKLSGRRPNLVVGGGTGRGSDTFSAFLEVFFCVFLSRRCCRGIPVPFPSPNYSNYHGTL